MGFAGYFLIVSDFIAYARRSGIPVGPGRGSSAGSLVAYSLGITGIDPIEYDIIFERFLNPERISMPDIDVDFCMRGPRPGDPLRRREVRRRGLRRQARRPDHHLRQAPGARGDPRRRARARHGLRRRRPHREADPRDARHHARRSDHAVARAARAHRGRRPGRAADRDRAAARRPDAPRLDPRRRRRDRHAAADRDGAALSRPQVRRRHDAVRHALRREGRPDQVRLPRAAHAHHDRRRRGAHPRGRRARLLDRPHPARRREDLRPARLAATPRACSRSNPPA